MPKFHRQNKRKIDPRYFLEETTKRDQPPWGGGGQPVSDGDPMNRASDLAQAGMRSQIDKDGDADDAAELLDITRDMLISQIRQGSKDLYNSRDMEGDLENKSLEELEDILYDQANSPEQREIDDMYRDREEDEMGRDFETPSLEMSPKMAGHGRMPGGLRKSR